MIRLALAIAAAATGLALALPADDPGTIPAIIRSKPVPLDTRDPAQDRAGALRYLGGWSLTSTDPRFGGLSTMAILGDRVLAIGDAGGVFRFRVTPDGTIDEARVGRLPDGPGRWDIKADRDAESMTVDPADGRIWVGFEGANAIWRYDPALDHAETHAAPRALHKWPSNLGPEALIRLPDGRFIVFAEDAPGPDNSTAAVLYASDPTERGARATRFGYRAPAGYVVTDVARLPDGRLLMLHRRFTLMDGVSAVLSILDPAKIVAGKTVEGIEIARLVPPLTVDNLEALAVRQERGRTIVWIASDDNFNVLQRTLLMKFALDEGAGR